MDEPLTAGSGANSGEIFRRGDTVTRPVGPHTPGVHALLAHLRAVGFDGAPRVLDSADDREVLEYIAGDVPVPPAPPLGGWIVVSDAALESIGRLLRRFHDAARDFVAPASAEWQGGAPPSFGGTSVCHNDPVVGNIVFRNNAAVALIDFDYAGPSDPVWDLAIAAQHWIPLADPADFVAPVPGWSAPRRLALLHRAYALPPHDVPKLLDAVDCYLERGRRSVQRRVDAGEPAFVAYWKAGLGDRLQRARQWLGGERSTLAP